jgi:catechol 2,3-dioxygenase-like lactoylglutathione lyase family enzyme
MIAYITLGTNDMARAGAFYDLLFADLGAARVMAHETYIGWSTGPDQPIFSVHTPFDGNPATVGNGVMISLAADSPEMVDRLHARALSLGATDEGAPGVRADRYYIGYFRDLDGNKLNFFCMNPS